MEIIKHGKKYIEDIAYIVDCHRCNCKFKINKSEVINKSSSYKIKDNNYKEYYIPCPECYHTHSFIIDDETAIYFKN